MTNELLKWAMAERRILSAKLTDYERLYNDCGEQVKPVIEERINELKKALRDIRHSLLMLSK